MNILMIHFRVGATDGVSLEMSKWKKNFEKLGHLVYYAAAEENQAKAFLIPEMSILSDQHKKLFKNCFMSLDDYKTDDELENEIISLSQVIENKLLKIINDYEIDLIVPNNVSSLGLHLPTGLAIGNIIKKTQVKVIYHHHDFYWERERYSNPTCQFIIDYLNQYFPFHNSRTKHCVINHIAQHELKIRKDIDSYVVPNVFDFKEPLWIKDDYTNELKQILKIEDHDLVILQATRIEDRKAIELALDVTHELYKNKDELYLKELYDGRVFHKDSKIHFIVAGLNEMRSDLFLKLKNKMDHMPYEIHLISDMIASKRSENPKKFALWDSYMISDLITYPSILEGWGNQLLEGLFAKKPMVIYEYPVYLSDIKDFNLDLISLGSKHEKIDDLYHVEDTYISKAVRKLLECLLSKRKYEEMVNKNFEIASKYLSFEALEKHLIHITKDI